MLILCQKEGNASIWGIRVLKVKDIEEVSRVYACS